jgi:hypothetical protein
MINCPKMPAAGTNKISGIYKTVQQILKVLPTLDVHGDGKTIKINESVGGKIISAIPQANSAITQGGGVATIYDGPWAFSTATNVQGVQFFRVRRGYFVRNGLYSRIKDHTTEPINNFGWQDFNVPNTFIADGIYYVYIYQRWVFSNRAWEQAEIRVTQDPPPESMPIGVSDLYGYCLLGWVNKTTVEEKPQLELHCYEIPVPIMFVAGECRTGENP